MTELLVRIPAIIIAFTFHEFSHGLAAYLLGDSRAKSDGRLSLNPVRHIDPLGFLCLLLFRFGWAKPVQIEVYNFKDPKADMAITAFAGPLSNLLLAFVSYLIIVPVSCFFGHVENVYYIIYFLSNLFYINISLAVFNMLPLPPLDGSKVIGVALPDTLYFRMISAERIGMILLLVLIWTDSISYVLSPVIVAMSNALFFLTSKIYFFL